MGVTRQKGVYGEGSRALAEDGDFTGVAAESADVPLDPGQGRALVEEAEVVGGEGEGRGAGEAEDWVVRYQGVCIGGGLGGKGIPFVR